MEYRGELLAPAGNMECLRAAVAAGADAIYLGGQQFGARAYAGNFTDSELLEGLAFAHFWGRKIYLTVNTLTKQEELGRLADWIAPFYEAGLDGVIVQDMGVLETLRDAFPELELHASTQMTVTESRSALFLKSLGVCRVVPARELCLEEVCLLKQKTGLALETFIHGALCYCYSGQCLFSSLLGGRSGNRGRCAQPCRQPYQILEDGRPAKGSGRQSAYPLSLKDLCALPFLPRLMDAGIDSFKIEGRMKRAEYVAGVTAIYRKYMDLYLKNPSGWQVGREDLELLSKLYVRSETGGGYYDRHNGRELLTLEKPGYSGCPEELLERLRREYLEKELSRPVSLSICLEAGRPAELTASCGGVSERREGAQVTEAKNRPLTGADVEKQLRKTGGSGFTVEQLYTGISGPVFLPVSALNELRRETLEALHRRLEEAGGPGTGRRRRSKPEPEEQEAGGRAPEPGMRVPEPGSPKLYVSAQQSAQARAALGETAVRRLYLSADLALGKEGEELLFLAESRKGSDPDFSLFLELPPLLRSYSEPYLKRVKELVLRCGGTVDGFLAGSLTGMCWARQEFPEKKLSLQHRVYVFNRETWQLWERCFAPDTYTAPLELNRQELKGLPANRQEMVVYGRLPMMISAGCVRQSAGKCRVCHTQEQLEQGIDQRSFFDCLKDRYGAEFPVQVNCRHCMNTIYNSVPLSLHPYLSRLAGQGLRALRLDFTDETQKSAAGLIRFFAGQGGSAPGEYTTGHYKKGVQ
ncbi:MAG: DUF3656 domain-containing protein [Eubacteriales bacterium]|nr:DUF3656 domain-containing protein [Eubacteriales bacterium]